MLLLETHNARRLFCRTLSRRVQVSSSDRCVPSSRKEFESCFEALVPCSSVSAVSVGLSRGRVLSESVSCVRCGVALVVGSGALCESCTHVVSVCVHDSGTDLIDHNSWKHGHEAAGETKVLSLSSGSKDRCSFVDTVLGGAALEQYLRAAPKGTEVEAWEGRIFTCSRPTSWDVLVAEGCKVTVSAVYLPKKRPGPPAAGPLYRILLGWSRLLYTASSGIWIFRGAFKGFAGSACSCVLF